MALRLVRSNRIKGQRSAALTKRRRSEYTALASRMKMKYRGTGFANTTPTLNAMRVVGYGLPDRFLCRLRFTDYINLAPAAGAYTEVFYRAIGPYDGRVSAGGDYPAYYAQIAALYQYQRTWKAKCQVWFLPDGAASSLANNTAEGVIYPTTTAAGVTGLSDAIDKRHSKFCSISIYQPAPTSYLTHTIIPHKELGMSKAQYGGSDDTRSLVGAVPSRILYWAIGIQANDGATTLAVRCRIRITYSIEFNGLVPIDTQDSTND